MKGIYYINEHTQCKNYYAKERCFFYQYKLNKDQNVSLVFENDYSFVFVTNGELELVKKKSLKHKLKEGLMYALGFGFSGELTAKADAAFFILTFDKPQILCDEFVLVGLKKYLPNILPVLPSLQMSEPIFNFLSQIDFFIRKKMFCKHLYALKQSEWFFLMRGFYTKKQNAAFFYELVDEGNSFSYMVQRYANQVDTVSELAKACSMSTKTLTRHFKKTFDTTPKQWLLEQKRQQVKLEVKKSNNPKELYDKLGFTSYSHLNDFCVKQLGLTMHELKSENVG